MSDAPSSPCPVLGARIVAIVGPTATGKTAMALELAKRFGGELVGADSVQVYRGFDLGSAKPTAAELAGVRHHLIDVIDPDQPIDAAIFAGLADTAIADARSRGALPIVVGGTGLWIRALLRGLVEAPPVDAELRSRLWSEAQTLGAPALHARLKERDARSASRIHPNDALRITRALEVLEQTGTPMGELHAEHALGAPRYDTLLIALDRPRDELRPRVEARILDMIARGWVDEVRALCARWGPDVRAFGSVGYRQILEHVRGEATLEEATARAFKATHVYVRRQRTWWRSDPSVTLRASDLSEDLGRAVAEHVERSGGRAR